MPPNVSQSIFLSFLRFHNAQDEPEMNSSVVIPLNDDVRLSVDDYRNKLYELMATHHARYSRTSNHSKIDCQNKSAVVRIIPDIRPKVAKDTERYLKSHYQVREKPHNTQSEPKMQQNKSRLSQTLINKSDSKLSKQLLHMPVDCRVSRALGDGRKHSQSTSEVQMKEKYSNNNRKILNSRSNVYTSFNSYNQNHGIITQSALMELRAAGMR